MTAVTAILLHSRLALAGLVRSPGRTVLRVVVVAAAVALLAGMLLFIGHSLRTASASAVRQVPLDWQGPVASYKQDLRVATAVARQPGIAAGIGDGDGAVREPEPLGPGGQQQDQPAGRCSPCRRATRVTSTPSAC